MLKIEDKYELLAIHRALLAVKFPDEDGILDTALTYSSYISDLSVRVIEEIIANSPPQKANDWQEWRKLDNSRLEWPILLRHIKTTSLEYKRKLSLQEKQAYIQALANPFTLDDNTMDRLLKALDSNENS